MGRTAGVALIAIVAACGDDDRVGGFDAGAVTDSGRYVDAWVPPPECSGSPPACTSLSVDDCATVRGCEIGFCEEGLRVRNCGAFAVWECTQITGCYVEDDLCRGSAQPCDRFQTETRCAEDRCAWRPRDACNGSATPCESLTGASCTTQPGCSGAPVDGGPDSGPAPMTTIAFVDPPLGTVHSREVTVSLSFDGAPPDRIQLRNGALLAELAAPYTYVWDTSSVPEGAVTLTADAIVDDAVVASASRLLYIDRTAPSITGWPSEGMAFRANQIQISERLDPATVSPSTVSLLVGGVAHPVSVSAGVATIDVRPTAPFPSLPTTATLEVATGITDYAGNPLPPGTMDLTFPAWVDVTDMPFIMMPSYVRGAYTAPDGSVYVAYRSESPVSTYVARWDGGVWETDMTRWIPRGTSNARIRVSAGQVLVGLQASNYVEVFEIPAGDWPRKIGATLYLWTSPHSFDFEVDGTELVVAQRGSETTADGITISRFAAGAWTRVRVPANVGGSGEVDLVIDSEGDFLLWSDGVNCHQARHIGGAWMEGPVLAVASCTHVVGARSALGTVYVAGVSGTSSGFLYQEGAGTFLEATSLAPRVSQILGTADSWFALQSSTTTVAIYEGDATPRYMEPLSPAPRLVSLDGDPAIIGGSPSMLRRPNRP